MIDRQKRLGIAVEKNPLQIDFGFLLGLIVGLAVFNFPVQSAWATPEGQHEPTVDYTIAFASLAPRDLDVFIANTDGADPQPLVSHLALDYNATFSPDGKWIAFTSHRDGHADVYRIHPDGSGLERLTDHPAFDDAATFSPDGQRIAFVSSRSGQADIWVLEIESGKTWNVTNSPGGDFRPAWSRDGQWLAFSSDRGTWRESDVYIIRPTGSALRRLTDTPGWDGSPSWSPDGQQVAYYSSQGGTRQIFTVEVNNPDAPRQITSSPGSKLSPHWVAQQQVCFSWAGRKGGLGCVDLDSEEEHPSEIRNQEEFDSPHWSAGGGRVVFHRRVERPPPSVQEQHSRIPGLRLVRIDGAFPSFAPTGESLVFTDNFRALVRIDLDGSNRREIYTDPHSQAFTPTWSPLGNMIAFTKGRVFAGQGTNNEIYLVNANGSAEEREARNLTHHPANDGLGSWSPDGQRLVFRSTRDGNKDLYIIGADGTGLTRLTTSASTDTFPHWSPLGDRIVFASNRSGDFEIYSVKPDGSDLKRLTNSLGIDMHPVWSPDGKWICFASARGGFKDEHPLTGNPQPYGDLYLMRSDGSEVQPLTDDQFEDGTPTWAPVLNVQ